MEKYRFTFIVDPTGKRKTHHVFIEAGNINEATAKFEFYLIKEHTSVPLSGDVHFTRVSDATTQHPPVQWYLKKYMADDKTNRHTLGIKFNNRGIVRA